MTTFSPRLAAEYLTKNGVKVTPRTVQRWVHNGIIAPEFVTYSPTSAAEAQGRYWIDLTALERFIKDAHNA